MEYCKLQIGCMFVILYITFNYLRECKKTEQKNRTIKFERLLGCGIVTVFFDGLTAYMVNQTELIGTKANTFAHLCFLVCVDIFIFTLFLYMLESTEYYPREKRLRIALHLPLVLNLLIIILNMDKLEYRHGTITNYSMGVPVYTCFIMVAVYIIVALNIFLKRWNYIERHKRANISLYFLVLIATTAFQMIVPEALITSIGYTVLILGVYLNQENPTNKLLEKYHSEMITGFTTLVEKRDGSTGGHIRRTSIYVELLAKELRERGYYKNVLTKDYIKNLIMSAPMHDIGKVSVPDSILQKPGKLTEEEFEIMKQHSENGGKIIRETFEKVQDEEYVEMAYQVAMYHHEKWNGCGYPEGLKENKIPLCARIMAIADVFDAVSEKRCYRDAMPMEKCFEIISEGKGSNFDPTLVDVFMDMREEIEEVHNQIQG